MNELADIDMNCFSSKIIPCFSQIAHEFYEDVETTNQLRQTVLIKQPIYHLITASKLSLSSKRNQQRLNTRHLGPQCAQRSLKFCQRYLV